MADTRIWTTAVHAGEHGPRPDFSPVATPIYATVAYTYESMADLDGVFGDTRPGYVYSRYGNPTVAAFEQSVAALEGADEAVAYSTGMAAVYGALLAAGAAAGATVVSAADVYGATYGLQQQLLASLGVRTLFVPVDDLDAVEATVARERPVAVYCETISNPLLRIADLPALARIAHSVGALLLVDATFTSPYLLQPLALGADIVLHSATKYLGGHGDAMGGVVACRSAIARTLRSQQRLIGSSLGPFEAWLLLRGIKTLPLRVQRQCGNALAVARHLCTQSRIEQVHYPGLDAHPQHSLAQRLLGDRGYGGIVSFVIRDAGREEVFRFMESLRLVQPATTLGDLYSLVLYPAHSSHRLVPAERRVALGIVDGLVRFNAGIEDVRDIIADLDGALAAGG
jgi:cystathionine gamma-synthase/methionine-gamma-lyase